MQMSLKGLTFKDNLTPLNQFYGRHLDMGQLGSGDGNQPFKTFEDYTHWIQRAAAFSVWADSAIVYFRKGMNENYVLPKALVVKIIPQCKDVIVDDVTKSLFWGPMNKIPASFNSNDKTQLTIAYTNLIKNVLNPTYQKLANFFEKEYLPKARTSSGISSNPTGSDYYKYLIEQWTTTNKTPDEIYAKGLEEVKRILGEMEKVKAEFMPYKTPEEVIAAFKNIQSTIDPNLKKMFGNTPKTRFEIRQTEAFRAASASAEYNQASEDGTRPGIFYIPIIDATKFNTTS
ncbi:unnamed protein product, partial [Rotaria sp. Silwood1]